MKETLLLAATAAFLSLPLALHAADKTKKMEPFLAADTDGDGRVTSSEYAAAMKGKLDQATAQTKFTELDVNKDGALSREEFNGGRKKKGGTKKKVGN